MATKMVDGVEVPATAADLAQMAADAAAAAATPRTVAMARVVGRLDNANKLTAFANRMLSQQPDLIFRMLFTGAQNVTDTPAFRAHLNAIGADPNVILA